MEVPYKTKLSYPTIQQFHSWAIYPEKIIQKNTCTTMFIDALFTIVKTLKQSKCPSADECPSTDEWIKMWNITQPPKMSKIMPFAAT